MLDAAIQAMYRELVDYRGDFGDSIDFGHYDPFDRIRDTELTPPQIEGVGVAVLCFLMSAADNSTHQDAVIGFGSRAQQLLTDGLLDGTPPIRKAVEAFLISEDAFLGALNQVYHQVVIPGIGPQA